MLRNAAKRNKSFIAALIALLLIFQSSLFPLLAEGKELRESLTIDHVTNGDFSEVDTENNTATGWQMMTEGTTRVVVEEGKIQFQIGALGGADWSNHMRTAEAVTLKAQESYHIQMTIESSVDRSIKSAFDGGRLGERTWKLDANEEQFIEYDYVATENGGSPFMIYLGKSSEEDSDIGEHTVDIKNISITSTEEIIDTSFLTNDGDPVENQEKNQLMNGNFENKEDGWKTESFSTDVYFNQYRTVFDIQQEGADWQQALYQIVDLDPGSQYTVSFTMLSTKERRVSAGFDNSGRDEFHSDVIPANEKTTLTYETTNGIASSKFMIYLGASGAGAHQVEITDVSIIPVPAELPDDQNDPEPEKIQTLGEYQAKDAFILKDGNFTKGLEEWDTYAVDWMEQYKVVKFTKLDDGMQVHIGNTGGAEGNKPYDVQLNQTISLKENTDYTLSFDVYSDKARSIKVLIEDLEGKDFEKQIGIQAKEVRHVSFNLPKQKVAAFDKIFSIQMGNVSGEVKDNNLVFKNLKIEVPGYSDLAVAIQDGIFNDGIGKFAVDGNVTEDASQKFLELDTTGSASLTRGQLKLFKGKTYDISFAAGAKENTKIELVFPNGMKEEIALTTDVQIYEFLYTHDTGSEISFNLPDSKNTIYLDSIRMDAEGFRDAAAMDTKTHDITSLNKKEAPVLSEDPDAIMGQDVTLTFFDDPEYREAIKGITINGTAIDEDKYEVTAGSIRMDQSLFTVGQQKDIFNITIKAEWYKENQASQVVYKDRVWNMTWQDEFSGSSLDTSKWSYQVGDGSLYGVSGWGNNEQQNYTKDNLAVDSGVMTITAKNENKEGKPYTSSRIWSMSDDQKTPKFAQAYGRFEAKMKLPAGEGHEGIWPAFWLLPADDSVYGSWPLSGEIDIMEARGREPNKADGTIHYGKPWPNNNNAGGSKVWEDDEYAITDYHVYGIEWTPDSISWLVDGEVYYTLSNWFSHSGDQPLPYAYPAPFDQEFYIIMNLAVGGSYDGNLTPDDSVLPADMKVDYVRVYQSAEPYDEMVEEPEVEKEPVPEKAKTEIIDQDFNNIKEISKTEDQDPNGWNFAILPDTQGKGSVSVVKEGELSLAKIDIENGGTQPYSLQLIQWISVVKGRYYKLSFDAKADAVRNMNVKIGGSGVGDSGWGVYSSNSVSLGKDLNHYEIIFQMLNDTNLNSRIEFNLGQSSANTYIGNVEFTEVDNSKVNPDINKVPLNNGNHIYNGGFDIGDTSRLSYWHTIGTEGAVTKQPDLGYVYAAKTTTGLEGIYQQGLELLQSDEYTLTFDGSSTVGREVEVIFSSADGKTVYAADKVTLTGTMDQKTVTFTMPEGVTDRDGKLTVQCEGTSSTILLDNFVLKRNTYNNIDFEDLNTHPLMNGDFELGKLGWGTYNTELTIKKENGTNTGHVKGKKVANVYDALLSYDGIELLAGYDYEFSFDAKASKDAKIAISMEDAGYTRYFDVEDIEIGKEWNTYSFNFKLDMDRVLALKFLIGGASAEYGLDLDNVVIKMKGAPSKGADFTLKNDYNKVNEDLVLIHNGSEEWIEKSVILIDNKEVKKDLITYQEKELILAGELFTKPGKYKISAKAEGFANTKPLNVNLYDGNGNRLINGDFNNDMSGWEFWSLDDSGAVNWENGYVKVQYHRGAQDQWGGLPSWSLQLSQDKIPVEAGKAHILSFVAASPIERNVIVTVNQKNGEKSKYLTLKPGVSEYQIELGSEMILNNEISLVLQLGTVNDQSNAATEAFDAHDLFFDCFTIIQKGEELPEKETNLGSQLPRPIVEVKSSEKGALIEVTPSEGTPDGVGYKVKVNGKAVVVRSEGKSYELNMSQSDDVTVEAVAVYPTAFVESEITKVTQHITIENGEPGDDGDKGPGDDGDKGPGDDGDKGPGDDGNKGPGDDGNKGAGNSGNGGSGTSKPGGSGSTSVTKTPQTSSKIKTVKTSDNAPIVVLGSIMIISGLLLVIMFYYKKLKLQKSK